VPTELSRYHSALRWTWAALIVFVIAGNILRFLGPGTPAGAITTIVGLVLSVVALVKTAHAVNFGRTNQGPPRA
jgi:uncharacterized membrane protein